MSSDEFSIQSWGKFAWKPTQRDKPPPKGLQGRYACAFVPGFALPEDHAGLAINQSGIDAGEAKTPNKEIKITPEASNDAHDHDYGRVCLS